MNNLLLRKHIVDLLKSEARMPFTEAVKDFPIDHINDFPPQVEYTFWHILEHIRRTQWDIIDYIQNPKYVEPEWPKDYWPQKREKATKAMWTKTVKRIEKDLQEMIEIVSDPKTDLSKPGVNGGKPILQKAFLIADHNAYHIGEFAILRQVTKTWKK